MTDPYNYDAHCFSRRDALKVAGAAGLACATSHYGLSSAFAGLSQRENALNIHLPDHLATLAPKIEGKLPINLRGTYYKNGPALRHGFKRAYPHWFDGDGFIQAFRFDGQTVQHQGQFVHTEKYNAESKAGDYFVETFSHKWAGSPPARSADETNAANTNIVYHGGRLMALWEAGSAWQVDPDNLDSMTKVVWHEDLAMAPFSAHPHIDDDGSLWNFGQVPWSQKMILYHINPQGKLHKYKLLDMPNTSMIHDFAITEKSIILVLPPLTWELDKAQNNASFLNAHEWHENRPVEILVIDKNDLSIVRRHQLPASFHFHIGSAYETGDGTIELDICHYKNADIVFNLYLNNDEKDHSQSSMRPQHSRVTLSPNVYDGKIERIHNISNEFPRMAPLSNGHRSQHGWSIGLDTETGLFRYALGVNLETGKVDRYDYGAYCMLEEHIFVADHKRPAVNGAIQGWLIGLHLDVQQNQTKLTVLDAYDLAAGPQAIVTLPYGLPPGLHGNFVTAA